MRNYYVMLSNYLENNIKTLKYYFVIYRELVTFTYTCESVSFFVRFLEKTAYVGCGSLKTKERIRWILKNSRTWSSSDLSDRRKGSFENPLLWRTRYAWNHCHFVLSSIFSLIIFLFFLLSLSLLSVITISREREGM
mgnify:CR=1 FL=1